MYQHKVDGLARIALHPRCELTDVATAANGIAIGMKDDFAGVCLRNVTMRRPGDRIRKKWPPFLP